MQCAYSCVYFEEVYILTTDSTQMYYEWNAYKPIFDIGRNSIYLIIINVVNGNLVGGRIKMQNDVI